VKPAFLAFDVPPQGREIFGWAEQWKIEWFEHLLGHQFRLDR
jgi:hypothetical protein